MYALVDCNNFYASCERVFQPKFNGKPVAILSNNDGCVIARSNEAKAVGVAMGVPAFQIKELVKKNNVKLFSSNYALYGDLSHRVMAILNQFTPNIEIYSIDEAFLNFDGLQITDYHKKPHNYLIIKQPGAKPYKLTMGLNIPDIKETEKNIAKNTVEAINNHTNECFRRMENFQSQFTPEKNIACFK
jgi:nucleotidyltransferase/DNA polymerase involved in DNA repair